MASPFAVFRRNQRVMLAVLGVMAMIAFVFLDPIFRILGRSQAAANPLIVKTNYGNFHASELESLKQSRRTVEAFLSRVAVAVVRQLVEQKRIAPREENLQIEQYAESLRQRLMGRVSPPGDAAAIETLIMARRAEELGIAVSDQTINEYLKGITANLLPPAELARIINSVRSEGGRPLSQTVLFDALRRELLASQFMRMFEVSLSAFPPAQRWEYFEKLNRKAEAQVLPVPVAQFIKDVPDPDEATLEKFFESRQNIIQQPNSPEPGFKQPAKAAFQYFKAEFEKFVERAAAQVTDEQLREYYEKEKDRHFRASKLPPVKSGEKDDAAAPDEQTKPDTDANEETAPGAGDEQAPATPPPSGAEKAGDKSSAPAGEPQNKTSHFRPAGGQPFRLVSDSQAKPAAPPAKQPPAASTPAEPTANANTAKPAEGDQPSAPAAGEATDGAAAPAKTTEKEPVQYEPFEKVADDIRKTLGQQNAGKLIEEAFAKLSAKVREYGSEHSTYLTNKEDNPDLQPPVEPDFKALADEYGLSAFVTDLMTPYELQTETDLGKSYIIMPDPRSRIGFRAVPFVQIAAGVRQLYRPETTNDDEGNRYLWWKIRETPEMVPDLADVRSKVLTAFKLIAARELARKQANAYAKEVREAKKTLKEVFGDREGFEVVETGPFTWMTTGNLAFDLDSSEPRLSSVHGVRAAGAEFMRAVFESEPGTLNVAMNQPEDEAYVIQVQTFEPPVEQLEHEFMVEDFRKYQSVATDEQRQLYQAWLADLEHQAGVVWLESPKIEGRGEQ